MVSESITQRVLPLVTFDRADVAADYGQVAWEAGLRIIEVGFRTSEAENAVATLRAETALTVVAGTLTSEHAVDQAIGSGAHWGIAPNFDSTVLDYAAGRGFSLIPGIATPTELGAAASRGLSEVKVYPVTQLGGAPYLATLRAVFPALEFIPSGGIVREELGLYLETPGVRAVSGSWLPSVRAESPQFDGHLVATAVAELMAAASGVR